MSDKLNFIYWDANVFLSYLRMDDHLERRPVLDRIIEEIRETSGLKLVTSVISKVEVAFAASEKAQQSLDMTLEQAMDMMWEDYTVVELVEVHDTIVMRARELMRRGIGLRLRLKPLDAIHLATAEYVDPISIHTYEPKWRNYETLIDQQITEPTPRQNRLPNM